MENREQVVSEYFKLRVLLNRSNSKANQSTEIMFQIIKLAADKFIFVGTLKGAKGKKLELCSYLPQDRWDYSGYTEFKNLEIFCANYLNRNFLKNAGSKEMDKLAETLGTELRSLGVSSK